MPLKILTVFAESTLPKYLKFSIVPGCIVTLDVTTAVEHSTKEQRAAKNHHKRRWGCII